MSVSVPLMAYWIIQSAPPFCKVMDSRVKIPALTYFSPISLLGFLITIATAFRLSKFNLTKNEHNYFQGLPSPANCCMIIGLPFMFDFLGEKYLNHNLLFTITIFSIYILNSKTDLFSSSIKS